MVESPSGETASLSTKETNTGDNDARFYVCCRGAYFTNQFKFYKFPPEKDRVSAP